VLFLDRTHARARAYIERARAVLGERQRETDELLHRGLAALDAGDTDHARTLLASAVRRGGAVEAAEVALERLTRLNVAGGQNGPAAPERAVADASARPARPSQRRLVPSMLALAALPLLFAAIAFALRWETFESWAPAAQGPGVTASVPRPAGPLPHPLLTDLALRRARVLFARGHLHEALAQLHSIRDGDPRRPEVDLFMAQVQRALLDAAQLPPVTSRASPTAAERR
jgi:hypothetical protein